MFSIEYADGWVQSSLFLYRTRAWFYVFYSFIKICITTDGIKFDFFQYKILSSLGNMFTVAMLLFSLIHYRSMAFHVCKIKCALETVNVFHIKKPSVFLPLFPRSRWCNAALLTCFKQLIKEYSVLHFLDGITNLRKLALFITEHWCVLRDRTQSKRATAKNFCLVYKCILSHIDLWD